MLNQPLSPIAPGLAASTFVPTAGVVGSPVVGGAIGAPGLAASGMAMPDHLNYSYQRDPFTGQSFGLHVQFIKSVWTALTFQWLLIALFVIGSRYSPELGYQLRNPAILWGSIILLLVLSVLTTCFYHWTKACQIPCFFFFSLLSALIVAHIVSRFPGGVLYYAAILTFIVVLLITLYSRSTFGSLIDGAAYLIILTVLLLGFLYLLFFTHLPALLALYAVIIVLLYSIFLIYYTHVLETKFGTIYGWEDNYLASQSMLFDLPQMFRNICNINSLTWRM